MARSIGEELVDGLRELTEALEARQDISKEFTVRRVKLNLQPQTYTSEMVAQTRKLLGASQAVFAAFIGVKPKTLQSWEQGGNPVSGAAARLMDEIRHDPEFWRNRLQSLAPPKATSK